MEIKDLTKPYRILMWGGGLISIVVGVGLLLLISFMIGEPLALLYPYVNETVLLIIQIMGWVYIVPGIIIFILGFWAKKLARYGWDSNEKGKGETTKTAKFVRIFVIITSILLILAIPIGTFVGMTLLRESWMLRYDNSIDSEEKKGMK